MGARGERAVQPCATKVSVVLKSVIVACRITSQWLNGSACPEKLWHHFGKSDVVLALVELLLQISCTGRREESAAYCTNLRL